MPNVLSPRDLVFRPDNMDETVPHTCSETFIKRLAKSARHGTRGRYLNWSYIQKRFFQGNNLMLKTNV